MSAGSTPAEELRPGTFGSLDRRIERLEGEVSLLRTGFAELGGRLSLIELEQKHSRDMQDAHFKTLEGASAVNLSEIRRIGERFDAAMLQGTAAAGDIASTPAGRAVVERLAKIERDKEGEHAELLERIERGETRNAGVERKMWMAAGATALAVLLITLIAPVAFRVLLP